MKYHAALYNRDELIFESRDFFADWYIATAAYSRHVGKDDSGVTLRVIEWPNLYVNQEIEDESNTLV